MLGTAYGLVVQHLFPGHTAPPGAYGLVGMGAMFAAVARAPITAVLMVFELTGEYRIILPLMFAIVLATGVSRMLSRETIYTLKLARRGIDLDRHRRGNLMASMLVSDAMSRPPEPVHGDLPARDVIARFAKDDVDALPVVDSAGRFIGALSRDHVERSLQDEELDLPARDLARATSSVRENQSLERALASLVRERSGLPVLSVTGGRVVGWLSHHNVLDAYTRRLTEAGPE
jgi:CIC family chloride channel protein